VVADLGGDALNGKSFKVLSRATYHPDPRRLDENRSVELCAPPARISGTQVEAPSFWDRLSDFVGLVYNPVVR